VENNREFDNDQDIARDMAIDEAKHKLLEDVERKVEAAKGKWEQLDALILHAWIHDPGRMKVALMYLNSFISEADRKMVEKILKGE
jgi:hypothetical protein